MYFFLQVLISIQSLILCLEPYYNEPGFERLYGTPQGDSESLKYSEDVFRNNLKYAVLGQLTNPPEGFEEVVRAHFYLKRDFLLEVCNLYLGFLLFSTFPLEESVTFVLELCSRVFLINRYVPY